MAKSAAASVLGKQINACGSAARITVTTRNDAETGLWFARQLGNIIAEANAFLGLSDTEAKDFVGSCYGQYVIAASLKPAIDAGPFNAQVLRMIKDGYRVGKEAG